MKTAIALGGGGAKGLAHIGVLRALDQAGITIDIVTGTSIGSLVGAAYAAGNLDQLEKTAREIRLADIPQLLSPAWSVRGLFDGTNALRLLSDCVQTDRIEQLHKPFAAVSVDLLSSRIVTHLTGDIRQAIRASIAIPVLFTPVELGDQVLVDGGTLEPIPVQAARELGADFVIAVDLFGNYSAGYDEDLTSKSEQTDAKLSGITSALKSLSAASSLMSALPWLDTDSHKSPKVRNLFEVFETTLAVSQRQLTESRLREYPADVVIRPPVADVGLMDFHRGQSVIERGRKEAEGCMPQLKSLL